jgi:iron transport multicopper oxidase
MTIVEVDGVYTKPQEVDSIYIATAQRYSVLLKTKGDASANYAITASMDTNGFDSTPDYVVQNVTAALIYNELMAYPAPVAPVAEINLFDDFNLVPYDEQPLLSGAPDVSFTLDLNFFQQDDQNRAGFNNITYIAQGVPTLATVLTTGKAASNASIYGVNTNAMIADYGQLVEVVVNNYDTGAHVMHIHGHAPQLVARVSGEVDDNKTITLQETYNGDSSSFPKTPIRRDSWVLAAAGYTVIRFIADNPGVWTIHCHMEWHVDAGLTATIIEAPTQLQAQTFPPAMAQICKDQNITTQGNAVGNVDDPYDLDGQVTVCPPNPNGAVYGGIGSSSGWMHSMGPSNTNTKKPEVTRLPAIATRLPVIATPLPKVSAGRHVWR